MPRECKTFIAHRFEPFPSDTRFTHCACGAVKRADWPDSINPCIQRFGPGPEGKTCKGCTHLVKQVQAKTWYKCELRDDLTHSERTDQRVGWPACAKFDEAQAEAQRFAPGQRVKIIANQGGLYAAQIGVVGVISKQRQKRSYGYRTYDVTYMKPFSLPGEKGREKIVTVREDDLEAQP